MASDRVVGVDGNGTMHLDGSETNATPIESPDALMSIWTIFKYPYDFPGKWVVRRSEILKDNQIRRTGDIETFDSLDQARKHGIPPGKMLFPRAPSDEAVIYESWL